ncbi:MAG: hypothetical protein FJ148_11665 [Deltaproteobacteria bacterium]|nr:hypothetical protein [Deltaproteobacteria bacterium]
MSTARTSPRVRLLASCFALVAGLAVAAPPARGDDVALRCQRAIESGGMRLARTLLRQVDRCSRSYGTSVDECLGSAAAQARIGAEVPRWRARVARACVGIDAHAVLGYLDTCGPADSPCGFAAPAVEAAGPNNDIVDCLACKVEERLRGVGCKLLADRPLGGACHASIAEPGLALLRDILGELNRCLRAPGALSIAGGLSEPERRTRIATATTAWLELDPGVRILRIAGKETGPISAYSGDGGPAIDARFNGVEGLAVDAGGNTLVGDFRNGRVRLVDRLGSVISVLGRDDGLGRFEPFLPPAPGAQVWGGCPGGIAVGPDDRTYVGDGQFGIVRILTKVPY